MKLFFTLLAILMATSAIHAQRFDRTRMDSLFQNLENKNLALGTIAITKNGKLIYHRSFGKGQSAKTVYRIGSITKMFTAVLVYQLIDDKRLSLTDTLGKYFPHLPNSGKITIAHLLGHRSGLANFTSNNTNYESWKDQPKSHEELLEMIKNQPPDFEPGTKGEYNNSNYLLLSYIIEKIYGQPYQNILAEKILRKIHLEKTYYGDHADFSGNEAISYKYFDSRWKADKAAFLDNFSGAGAIISTPQDLCEFIKCLFDGRLINSRSLDQMKNIVNGYGMGMFPYGNAEHPGFGHNGKTEGFASSLQYYPENKLVIAYCTNGEVYPKDKILEAVFAICFNLQFNVPNFKIIDMPVEVLERYTGTYSSNSIEVVSTVKDRRLILETQGQRFKLDAISDYEFWNIPFGFFFEFHENGKRLLIKEVEKVYELDRK